MTHRALGNAHVSAFAAALYFHSIVSQDTRNIRASHDAVVISCQGTRLLWPWKPRCPPRTVSSARIIGKRRVQRRFLAITGPNLRNHRRIELIADRQSALSQEILDIPVAQGEPEVESGSVLDDIWRKSVVGKEMGFMA